MKVERVSYEVMTPSAARGVLEAVLWQPSMSWHIHAIHVLAPVRWTSFRRNEVKSKASASRREPYLADEDRDQRNTVALRDVEYVIEASVRLTSLARPGVDTSTKYDEMFSRRLARGQHHHAPYLGCREFAADVGPAPDVFDAIDHADRPLGWMFWDFDWERKPADGAPTPLFFSARLTSGVLHVPAIEEVRAAAPEASP